MDNNENYLNLLRGNKKLYNNDTLTKLKSDSQLIYSNTDDVIASCYKLFFRGLALLHIELMEHAELIKTEGRDTRSKFVYHLYTKDITKYQVTRKILAFLTDIHSKAVSYTQSEDNNSSKEFRTIKPPLVLSNFHELAQININTLSSQSVRPLRIENYQNFISTLRIRSAQAAKKRQDMTRENYIKLIQTNNSTIGLLRKLKTLDPDNELITHLRIINHSHAYRVGYIDRNDKHQHFNINNGIILLDPPSRATRSYTKKKKQRSDKKINVWLPNARVSSDGSLLSDGYYFCLSDAINSSTASEHYDFEKLCEIFDVRS